MAGVIKYDKKSSLGPVSVVRQSQGADILGSAISKSADHFSGLIFERAAKNAQRLGEKRARSITQSELYGIGPDGKRDPYSTIEGLFSGGGTIQRQAFEATARQRFSDSIESDMQNKSAEISFEVDGKPDSTERFEALFSDYIASVTNTVGDEFKGFTTDTGSAYLASRRVSLFQAQEGRRKAGIEKAAAERHANLIGIARQNGQANGMKDVPLTNSVQQHGVETEVLKVNTVTNDVSDSELTIQAASSGNKKGREIAVHQMTGAFEHVINKFADSLSGVTATHEIRMAIYNGDASNLTASEKDAYDEIIDHMPNITYAERLFIYNELSTTMQQKEKSFRLRESRTVASNAALEKLRKAEQQTVDVTIDGLIKKNDLLYNDNVFENVTDVNETITDLTSLRSEINELQLKVGVNEAGATQAQQAQLMQVVYSIENQALISLIEHGLSNLDIRQNEKANPALLASISKALQTDNVDSLIKFGIIKHTGSGGFSEGQKKSIKDLFKRADFGTSLNDWFENEQKFMENKAARLEKDKTTWLIKNQTALLSSLEAAVGTSTVFNTTPSGMGGEYIQVSNVELKTMEIKDLLSKYGPLEIGDSLQGKLRAASNVGQFNNLLSQMSLDDATLLEVKKIFAGEFSSEILGDAQVEGTIANQILSAGEVLTSEKRNAVITSYYSVNKGKADFLAESQKDNVTLFKALIEAPVSAILESLPLNQLDDVASELRFAFLQGEYPEPTRAIAVGYNGTEITQYGIDYKFRKKLFAQFSDGVDTFGLEDKAKFQAFIKKEIGTRKIKSFVSTEIEDQEQLNDLAYYIEFGEVPSGVISDPKKFKEDAIFFRSLLSEYGASGDLAKIFLEQLVPAKTDRFNDERIAKNEFAILNQVLNPNVKNMQTSAQTSKTLNEHFFGGKFNPNIYNNAERILNTEGPSSNNPNGTKRYQYLNHVISNRDGVMPIEAINYFKKTLSDSNLSQANGVSSIGNLVSLWRQVATYTDETGVIQPNVFSGDDNIADIAPMLNVLAELESTGIDDSALLKVVDAYRELNSNTDDRQSFIDARNLDVKVGNQTFDVYVQTLFNAETNDGWNLNASLHSLVRKYANGLYLAKKSTASTFDAVEYKDQLIQFFNSRLKESQLTINTQSIGQNRFSMPFESVFGNKVAQDAAVQWLQTEFAGVSGNKDLNRYEGLYNITDGLDPIASSKFFQANPYGNHSKSKSASERFEGGNWGLDGKTDAVKKLGYLYLEVSPNSTEGNGSVTLVVVNNNGQPSYPKYPPNHPTKAGQNISLNTNDPNFQSLVNEFSSAREDFLQLEEKQVIEAQINETIQTKLLSDKATAEYVAAIERVPFGVNAADKSHRDVKSLLIEMNKLESGDISMTDFQARKTEILGSDLSSYSQTVLREANLKHASINEKKTTVYLDEVVRGVVDKVGHYADIKLEEVKAMIQDAAFIGDKEAAYERVEERVQDANDEVLNMQDTLATLATLDKNDPAFIKFLEDDPKLKAEWEKQNQTVQVGPAVMGDLSNFNSNFNAAAMPSANSGISYELPRYPHVDNTTVAGSKKIMDKVDHFKQMEMKGTTDTFIVATRDNMIAALGADIFIDKRAGIEAIAAEQARMFTKQANVAAKLAKQKQISLRKVLNKRDQDALRLEIDTKNAAQALSFKEKSQKALSGKALKLMSVLVGSGKIYGTDFVQFKSTAKPFYTSIWGNFYSEEEIPDYFFVELEKLMKDE